jgi:hypothetical protein
MQKSAPAPPALNKQCKMYRLTGNCLNRPNCKLVHIAPKVAEHKKLQLKQSQPFQMSKPAEFKPAEFKPAETKISEKKLPDPKPAPVNQFPGMGMVNQFPGMGMPNQFPGMGPITMPQNFQSQNHHDNTDAQGRPKLKATNQEFNMGNQNFNASGGLGSQGSMNPFGGDLTPEMWQQQMFMMQQQMAMNMNMGMMGGQGGMGGMGGMDMNMMAGMMGGQGGMGGMGGMDMFGGMEGMDGEDSDDEEFDEDQFVDDCKDCDCCDGFPFICKNSDFCRDMDQCFCIMKLQTEETIKEENAAYREDLKDCDCCKGYYLKCHGQICEDLGACHCYVHAEDS